ncbi:MAG TPA: CHASE domain-containing protein [Candidatus Saccharimonas sp.]|nr:CHASE domain-containing protein [Candidatus Saccharibacteria bacterium]HPQ82408.1 CHASE domain-containing protein [Candidatus Saccharimonas sp.]
MALPDFISPKTKSELKLMNRSSIVLPVIVLLFGLVVTGMYAAVTRETNDRDFKEGVVQQADSMSAYVETSMKPYGQLLEATAALLGVKPDLTADEWKTFYERTQSHETLSALIGIGYVPVVSRESASDSVQMDSSIDAPLTIYPEGDRDMYAPIQYLEPRTEDNQKAIGFDMYSNSTRRSAMEEARDTGKLVMSAPLVLVQDREKKEPNYGVLIYQAVYRSSVIPDTVEERRAQLIGYTYVVMHPYDVVNDYQALNSERFVRSRLFLKDTTATTPDKAPILYARNERKVLSSADQYHALDSASVFGRTWTTDVAREQLQSRSQGPTVILVSGGLLSLLLSGVVLALFVQRIHGIQRTLQNDVQRTKDELLALASHQLRTPASAVKQYIGMLKMGIVGDLTPEQKALADKAYDTNERQLNIINELLYVSKLDAGQLVIDPREMNLTAFVQKTLDDNIDHASEKGITLQFSRKQPITIIADSRYVSMVIDNLVSNAIKYSYPSTKVYVSIKSDSDYVLLSVKDSGVGLHKDDIERIFHKFTRVDNPLSRESGGSGLGLFLARQLARAHGGDITVESEPEKGSIFTLRLPKTPTIDTNIVHLDPTYGDK